MSDIQALNQQLDALKQAYVRQLPARLREIEDLWTSICDGVDVAGVAEMLYHLTHKLCGSGPTFGLPEVAAGLGHLEHTAKRLMQQGGAPTAEDRRRVHEDLASLRRRLGPAVTRMAASAPPAPSNTGTNAFVGARILLVEDDALTRGLIANGLRQAGFEVETAENGLMALVQARKQRPDAIMLDYHMPVMDGVETVRRLREDVALQHVPVFLITTYSSIDDVRGLLDCSVDGFLTKPVNLQETLDRLLDVLGTRDRRPAAAERPRVLIVDDDSLFRQQAALLLERGGYDVVEAENGMAGLRKVEQTRPALILMDVIMPVLDGFKATEHLRASETGRDIPIILLTNRIKNPDVTRAMQVGADAYIAKPQVSRRLVEKVRAILVA